MAVEEIRGNNGYHSGNYDNFPVGMRVLAVDDDPTCLRLLEALLRKCQYRVTVKSRAREALQILRENRDRFDLVISDVHMPDMDGFKLLELVGLEMDLPVIMLSENGDPNLVMKGVTHGACDYLLKPIRMEELRNIWQHVIRRKRFDYTKMNKSTGQTNTHQASGQGKPSLLTGNVDQNEILNRKRKDDVDEHEVNGDENEDPATQKKPRVVWSIELHRKFVAAVNQLGIEKALPKRILDMMNVEGLTRENVASHLQKYRIYLKRISSVATQHANMAAALGIEASTFVRLGTLDGLDDIRTLAGSRSFPNTASSPYSVNGMLGRLNSSSGVNLHNLTSSALVQPNHLQIASDSMTNVGKFHPVISPGSQNASLFQHSLDASRMFTADSSFMDTGEAIGSSSNSLNGAHNNSLISTVPLFTMQLPEFQLNSLTSTESLHGQLPLNIVRDNNSSDDHCLQSNPLALTSTTMDAQPFEDSRGEMQFQEGLVNEWRRSSSENYLSEQANLQGCFVSQSYGTLDDLVNEVVKLEQDENLPDGNFGFDDYSFGQGL